MPPFNFQPLPLSVVWDAKLDSGKAAYGLLLSLSLDGTGETDRKYKAWLIDVDTRCGELLAEHVPDFDGPRRSLVIAPTKAGYTTRFSAKLQLNAENAITSSI